MAVNARTQKAGVTASAAAAGILFRLRLEVIDNLEF